MRSVGILAAASFLAALLPSTANTEASLHGAVFGDWRVACRAGGTADCALVQRSTIDNVAPMTIRIVTLEGGAPHLVVTTPLRTALKAGLALTIDDGRSTIHPFDFCDERGCHSAIALQDGLLAALRRGLNATLALETVSGDALRYNISLRGVTAGTNALF
ncbi:MAG: invasion associated locus B family protein [Pseudomonadota bacterium]